MIGKCTECPHRGECIALCPEAEAYADQDHHRFQQLYCWAELPNSISESIWEESESFNQDLADIVGLTPFEIDVLLLRYGNFSYPEIAEQLKTDIVSVSNALYRARRKMKTDFSADSRARRKMKKGLSSRSRGITKLRKNRRVR